MRVPRSIRFVLACLLLSGCQPPLERERPPASPDTSGPILVTQLRWQCDFDADSVDAETALLLTGDSSLEREVHDCQRLIVDGEFGPLVGVFPFKPSMGLDDAAFSTWRRVATVWNWGWSDGRNARYAPLDIEEGPSCLYLRKVNSRWQALMIGRTCTPTHGGTPLPVFAQQYQGPDVVQPPASAYPPTARFRWNGTRQTYSIGVKCGDNWCTVGLDADPPVPFSGPLLRTVPGFFDEQPLAVYDSVADTLRPGPVGRLYPTALLQRAHVPGSPLWESSNHYATIEVHKGMDVPAFDYYVGKFGLEVTSNGRRADGELLLTAPTVGPAQAHIRAGAGSKPAAIVDVVGNTRHSADGTVRWRWLEQDEAAWIPCKQNDCCTAVWR